MHPFNFTRRIGIRSGLLSFGAIAGLTVTLLCSGAAFAQENPDPSLSGVSRSFIEANGLPATELLSARGFNELGSAQIPRSGFDLINDGTTGVALLRGIRQVPDGPCAGLTDDAFFLIHTAGRPGDADGNGDFNGNSDPCAARRNNLPPIPANPRIFDGSATDLSVLASGENMRLTFDRNCDGKLDLIFALTVSGVAGSQLVVEVDDFTGQAGDVLGGQGVAWEAAVFPGENYNVDPCPDPAGINGYFIFRINEFSKYFESLGLNPTAFRFAVAAGSVDDGLGEDSFAGSVNLSQPLLDITKGPDLALCPTTEGNWTIGVTNEGNVAVTNIVVTDVLPAGVTLVSVVSPAGITASGTTGTITFTPFDLEACASQDIVIRVRANADCVGDGVNSATAEGVFTTFCGKVPGTLSTVPVLAGPATANFRCLPGPCVTATCTPNVEAACDGEPVELTVRGTNCSDGPVTMVLEVGVGTPWHQTFTCPEPVGVGLFCEHTFTVEMLDCEGGENVIFPSRVSATNACGTTVVDTPNACSVRCKSPDIEILKEAEAEVQPGGIIHYTITVTNESKDTDLTNVVVVDELCDFVTGPTNFGGTCDVGAPTVSPDGSTITWPPFNLPRNSSCTLTFEVTAVGNATPCTETVTCVNNVRVTGDCGDDSDSASSSASTVIPCAPPGLCRLTGGGCLNEDGGNRGHKQSTFGGNSSPAHEGGGPTGNEWQHVYRDGREILFNWHSHDANVVQCSVVPPGPCSPNHGDITRADFVGTGLYSLDGGGRDQEGNMVAYIIDHREGSCPGNNQRDEYSIVVREGLVIGQGDIVFQTSGEIDCGNLQIHQTPARLFGGGAQVPEPQSGIESIALLNKVIPNPFTSSMSFAYEVPEGGADVQIGVYNVAGRLVKSLASGSQSAGRQSLTWDGRDASGVQMARGVYFLKAAVAGKQTTHRVIYVNP